jgi:hypothetical protein
MLIGERNVLEHGRSALGANMSKSSVPVSSSEAHSVLMVIEILIRKYIYYKQYCRILTRVISAVKRAHYNRMILKSNNKVKGTWRIINEEKGNIKRNKGINSIVIGKKVVTNQEKIATAFNKYFLSIADSIIPENNNHTNKEIVNPITYLVNTFSRPFNKTSWKYAISYEI